MKRFLMVMLVLTGVLSGPQASTAQDFDRAMDAYDRNDFATAFNLLKPIAERGDAKAQTTLGYMYSVGEGVLEDHAEAAKWYRRAAVQGAVMAQRWLGLMYASGDGLQQDMVAAHMWSSIAGVNGHKASADFSDVLATTLSPTGLNVARHMAKRCMNSGYEDCGQ